MSDTRTGGCLCGAARYVLENTPDHIGACHCSMCRKFSGGIELGLYVAPDSVTWKSDDSVQVYKSSEWAERGFCGICGSGLFYRIPPNDVMPEGMLSLSAGSLDDLNGLPLTQEVYIDNKPDGYAFAGKCKQMTEQEVLDEVASANQGNTQ